MSTGLIVGIVIISGVAFAFTIGQEVGYKKAIKSLAKKHMNKIKIENHESKHSKPNETRVRRKRTSV